MEVDKVKLLQGQNWGQEPVCLTGHASASLDCPKEPAEPGRVSLVHSLVTFLALSWNVFNHCKPGLLYVFFMAGCFTAVLCFGLLLITKPRVCRCVMVQTGQRLGMVTWEQCQLFAVWILFIVMSWCKKYPAVFNVKLAIPHLLERWYLFFFFCYEGPKESDNHEGQEDILRLSAVWLCLKEWRAFHFASNQMPRVGFIFPSFICLSSQSSLSELSNFSCLHSQLRRTRASRGQITQSYFRLT